jgi:Uma2 family endonuclease
MTELAHPPMTGTAGAAANVPPPGPAAGSPPTPPLREGDRMDCDEFIRRWNAMPEPRSRAELLEGVVHFKPMTIREDRHGVPQAQMMFLLMTYQLATPGTLSATASLRLNWRNIPEPDGYLRVLETHGGRSRRAADGFVDGPAELVVEVSAATVRKDSGLKFDIYRRAGVLEYVLWKTETGGLEWFVRREDRFDPLPPDDDGVIRSEAFPGLWADTAALMRNDLAAAPATLQRGLASAEHAAFVERLRAAAEPPKA